MALNAGKLQKGARLLLVALAVTACSAPFNDAGSALGRQAIIDETNQALDVGDCTTALTKILPLYSSADSDNEVRMITASAYACHAKVNFFDFLNKLTTQGAGLNNGALWAFLTLDFPSKLGQDYMAEGAELSMDAVMAVMKTGIPILPANEFNIGFNTDTILVNDRTSDSNAYLTFLTMAAIGAFQSRYGNPFPSGKKGNPLPWTSATAVDSNGCAYASAILNMVDSMGALAASSSSLSTSVAQIQAAFQASIGHACEEGCTNANPGGGWVPSGCTVTTTCNNICPAMLHDRSACTGLASDQVSCAASGIVNFINVTPIFGWQDGP